MRVARSTAENLNTDDQIFKKFITNDNLSNSKTQNIHATIKSSIHCSNRLIVIENSLNSVDRQTSTTTFATIDEILIEKEWNAIKIEDFESYINDYNFEDSLIVSLTFRNRSFAIKIFLKQSTLSMNYAKKKYNDVVAIIEITNFNTSVVVLDSSIS